LLSLAVALATCHGGRCGAWRGKVASAPARPLPPLYPSGKPYTRWWWFPTEASGQDIDAEFEWIKANGFGGVEIAWVNPRRWWPRAQWDSLEPTPSWRDAHWADLVRQAKTAADRLGLGCDFTFGSGWPFGDAEVTEDESACLYPDQCGREVSLFWEGPGHARVLDPLNRKAFDRYADRTLGWLRPSLGGSPSGLFCDSWELGLWPWSPDFASRFQRRFGYDITSAMDTLDEASNDGQRYDYMALLSDQIIDNFYRPFAERAHVEGSFVRTQAHGAPVDLLTAYSAADVPETEAMLYEPPFGQIAASAAALTGKPVVSSETFTCTYGFPDVHFGRERTADLKLVADALFANGVNQIVWHGKPFVSPAVPEARFYATAHVGADGALADELPAFNDYMAKVSRAMRRGRTLSQAAVYLPTEDSWMSFFLQDTTDESWTIPYRGREIRHAYPSFDLHYLKLPAALKGWRPLWVNNWALKQGKVEAGRLHIGDQVFSALYLGVYHLDSDALDTVLSLAKAGLPVCLERPPQQPGAKKSDSYQARLDQLQRLPNTSCDRANRALGKPMVAGDDLPDFWARADGDRTTIFFANPDARDLHLPIQLGQSTPGNATRKVDRTVEITVSGKTVAVPLSFETNQSLLVTIDGAGHYELEDIVFRPRSP